MRQVGELEWALQACKIGVAVTEKLLTTAMTACADIAHRGGIVHQMLTDADACERSAESAKWNHPVCCAAVGELAAPVLLQSSVYILCERSAESAMWSRPVRCAAVGELAAPALLQSSVYI